MEFMDLKNMLVNELEEISQKGELSAGDLDAVQKLTDTIKNIYKINCLQNEEGYSMRPYMHDDAYSSPHWVKGHYSRDAENAFKSEIRHYMDDSSLSPSDRQTLNRALDILRK